MTKRTVKAAAIYCRLSKDRSGESLGIGRQEHLCRSLAGEKGWPVAEVYVDRDISAYSGKRRPSYLRLVDDLKNGVRDAVLVVDQDRLTRHVRELEDFISVADMKGVALACVSGEVDLSTSDGRFRARIMGTVARQESEKKSERLRRQREHAAHLGAFQGGPRRYGYEPDGVTVRRDEAKVIRDIARRLLDGESMRSVVLDLNDRGVPSAQGGTWSVSPLRRMMTSPRLAGLRVHHGEIVSEAAWKPILDRNTHERLRALLIDGRPAARGRPPASLLGGIALCARCGARLHQTTQRDRRIYRCSAGANSRSCPGVTIRADDLDHLMTEAVLRRLDTKGVARALARPRKRGGAETGREESEDVAALDADLEALARDWGLGRITRREYEASREPLEARKRVALHDVETSVQPNAAVKMTGTGDVRKAWKAASIERRREVITELTERISVAPAKRYGSNAFDPDRVDVVWKV